ncbi:Tnks [Symbiodinium sp. CCMP2592]|nr:Tnks [Symbiodinium sp. CCMP2592]
MEKSFVASLEAQARDLFQKLRQDEGIQESLPTTTTTTTSLQPLAMAVKEAASKDVGALAAHRAAIHNRAATLRFLHEVGVSINATDKFGQTPAHVAAKRGNVEALEALREAGADMEAADDAGDTPLHAAAFYCEVEAVRFLIQAGVNKTAVNKNGKTPADINACAYEQEVELLLQDEEAGQSLQPTAGTNTTSLQPAVTSVRLPAISVREAAEKGNVSALAAHRKAGVDLGAKLPRVFEEIGWTPAHYAAITNHSSVLRFLHEVGVDLNAATDNTSFTPAHLAAGRGYVAVLQALHEAGANMAAADAAGETPLHLAARSGEVGALRFLIQVGANQSAVDFLGRTPADLAFSSGQQEAVELLKASITTTPAGSWDSTYGNFEAYEDGTTAEVAAASTNITAVREAAEKGNVSALAEHRKAGVNLSAPVDEYGLGLTPAHYAAIYNRSAALRYLSYQVGVDITATDHEGRSAAYWAAERGKLEALEVLREAGADMEAADHRGDTPLHAAVLQCQVDAVRFLIQAGVNKTVVDKEGRTPVDMNACSWEPEVAFLLQAQITTTTTASWGSTSGYLEVFNESTTSMAGEFEAYDGMTTGKFEAYDGMTTGKFEAYDGMTTGKFEAYDGMTTGKFEAFVRAYDGMTTGKFEAFVRAYDGMTTGKFEAFVRAYDGMTTGKFEAFVRAYDGMTTEKFEAFVRAYDGMTTGKFEAFVRAYDGMTTGKFEAFVRAYDGMTTGKFEVLAPARGLTTEQNSGFVCVQKGAETADTIAVMLAMQRSGTNFLAVELSRHPCIDLQHELFNDLKKAGFPWKVLKRFLFLDFDASAIAHFPENTQDILSRSLESFKAGVPVRGFNWKLNQDFLPAWGTWLPDLMVKHRVRLIWVQRNNLLRRIFSNQANKKTRTWGTTNESVAKTVGSVKVQLDEATILEELRKEEEKVKKAKRVVKEAKRRGLRVLTVYYENVSESLSELRNFLLDGTSCAKNADAQLENLTGYSKIHTKPLQDSIENFEQLRRKLLHTKWEWMLYGS